MESKQPNPKTFDFKTGVTVETTNDKVTATAQNSNKTIQSTDLDNFSYAEHTEQRMTFVGVLSRMFVIGLLLVILNKVLFGKLQLESQAIIIGCTLMGLAFVLFLITVIDSFLELGITNNIINNFFSNRGYYITIGNKSGNNIEFITELNELELIKELETKIYELKKSAVKNDATVIQPNSNLDELKKLSELLNAGIITQTEFDQKKKQLLKLN
ncbi:SHOCT domain-containing protein [Flavobacterium terrigena]|uniref:Short C-terminal domain-containing protein n=1 Tax=Flavobacterium terrigena TaxID=402734 RepID=A0A1H6URP6_9FLAO|nr:SHOCT domain-containing protein [Flavobacterium terrigena]SEI93374.1 Short C-terminal domain-containing protein [Flavobacterium terrigena]